MEKVFTVMCPRVTYRCFASQAVQYLQYRLSIHSFRAVSGLSELAEWKPRSCVIDEAGEFRRVFLNHKWLFSF